MAKLAMIERHKAARAQAVTAAAPVQRCLHRRDN
jgi:hypothetical protein